MNTSLIETHKASLRDSTLCTWCSLLHGALPFATWCYPLCYTMLCSASFALCNMMLCFILQGAMLFATWHYALCYMMLCSLCYSSMLSATLCYALCYMTLWVFALFYIRLCCLLWGTLWGLCPLLHNAMLSAKRRYGQWGMDHCQRLSSMPFIWEEREKDYGKARGKKWL